jgi:hypothetical protein
MPSKRKRNEAIPKKALKVMGYVANTFKITQDDMLSNCRERTYVDARHMAMLLLYDYIYRRSKTLSTVGGWFNRYHTSVIHGMRKISDLIDVDSNFSEYYEHLKLITAGIVEVIKEPRMTYDDRINRLPEQDKADIITYLEKIEKLRGIV